jgi:uncharacterized protein YecT (DUF1311 family)
MLNSHGNQQGGWVSMIVITHATSSTARVLLRSIGFVFVLIFTVASCHASPSFRCGPKLSRIEKSICADSDLAGADSAVAQLYAKLKASYPADKRASLINEQRQWVLNRDTSCPSEDPTPCLKDLYRQRIHDLEVPLGLDQRGFLTDPDFSIALIPGTAATFNGVYLRCQENNVSLSFPGNDAPPNGLANTLDGRGDLGAAFADCTLADGTKIRVKAGLRYQPMAYGECGASPPFLLSIWINQHKVVSSWGYTNFCEEPFLTSLSIDKASASYCLKEGADFSGVDKEAYKPNHGLCGNIALIAGLNPDRNEFPGPGVDLPALGSYRLEASGPIRAACEQIMKQPSPDGLTYPAGSKVPDWHDAAVNLPQPDFSHLGYNATTLSAGLQLRVADFDLTNTGTITKVYLTDQGNHWFDGSAFGVERKDILVTPFDAHDWGASTKKGIYTFTYSHAQVFFLREKTYILLNPVNTAEDPSVVMINGESISTVCTFHRQQENF